MKFQTASVIAAFLAATTLGAAPAQADLIQGLYLYPDTSTVYQDYGTQNTPFSFDMSTGIFTVSGDTTAATLTINIASYFPVVTFNGPELIDLSVSDITNVLLDASSTIADFDQSRITFDASHIWLNMEGLGLDGDGNIVGLAVGSTVVVDITRSDEQPVPEPSTFALFGACLAAFGALRRQKLRNWNVVC